MADRNPYEVANITVNIPVTDAEKTRLLENERTWAAPRLVALTALILGVSLVLLYTMSSTTAEVSYPRWYLP